MSRRKRDDEGQDQPPGAEAPKADEQPKQPKRRGGSIAPAIRELIAIPNSLIAMVPPLADDALSVEEADVLTVALDKYQATNPKARAFLLGTVERAGLAGLIVVGVLIALPRLERHGLIPAGFARRMADAQAQAEAAARAEATGPRPVGAPAPFAGREDLGYDYAAQAAGV